MTVSTFWSDAGTPGTTTIDGYHEQDTASQAWATKRDSTASITVPATSVSLRTLFRSDSTTDTWSHIFRSHLGFNTGPTIPSINVVSAAELQFSANDRANAQWADSLSLVLSTPTSNTAMATADFNDFGTTKQATDVLFADVVIDVATDTGTNAANKLVLNSTGIGNIAKGSGVTNFGLRTAKENDTTANPGPTPWTASTSSELSIRSSDEADVGVDTRPRLVVTHAVPGKFFTFL